MSTSDIYKNVPEINNNIQLEKKAMCPINKPNTTPIKQSKLDTILNISARFIGMPARRKTAKLPISCGNSWQNTAIDVVIPGVIPVANAAPSKKIF